MGNKSRMFRRMLEDSERVILMPGVYDALTARLAELAGFDAVFHTGFGTAAVRLAMPDIGLVSFGEMVEQVRLIANAVNIPVLADADTGYGNAINVYRTVKEYIRAGAAGLIIEDQVWPKRCGHLPGKQVVPLSEMVERIKGALRARNEEDPDFVIGARTDALAVYGIDEAIKRARKFAELDVDFVFVEAPTDRGQIERIAREVKAPLLLNLVEGGKTPLITLEEAKQLGFKIILYPVSALLATTKAVLEVFRHLRERGTTADILDRLMSFKEFESVVGLDKFLKLADELKVTEP